MGFRNPITTAAAIDTGHGQADAGVRLYQDLSNPAVPQGVAEWRTGLMARNATAKLSGGASGGSAFTLDGGQSSDGTNAPTLGLDVESAPTGGYRPVLRLTAGAGGAIIADTALTPLAGPTALTINGTFFAKYDTTPGETGSYRNPCAWKLASGLVVVGGLALANSVSFSFGTTIVTLPAGMRPAKVLRFVCQAWGGGAYAAEVNPNGAITYASGVTGTATAGSWVSLAGISFPGEQ